MFNWEKIIKQKNWSIEELKITATSVKRVESPNVVFIVCVQTCVYSPTKLVKC